MLCVVASFAVGILILILTRYFSNVIRNSKRYKKYKQQEESPRNVEVMSAITTTPNTKTEKMLITRHNDTPFSDTSIASDRALLSSPTLTSNGSF